MQKELKSQYGGKDILKSNTDVSYWNEAASAMGQVTKAFNEMNSSKDTSSLEGLFGKTDLTEVIGQLELITGKLEEISTVATNLSTKFDTGLNVTSSVEEITKLTEKVKTLEDELSKLKSSNNSTSSSTPSTESEDLTKVKQAAQEAATAKETFVDANNKVATSVDGSVSKLQEEANLFKQIAAEAKAAAESKNAFVKANEKIADNDDDDDDTGDSGKGGKKPSKLAKESIARELSYEKEIFKLKKQNIGANSVKQAENNYRIDDLLTSIDKEQKYRKDNDLNKKNLKAENELIKQKAQYTEELTSRQNAYNAGLEEQKKIQAQDTQKKILDSTNSLINKYQNKVNNTLQDSDTFKTSDKYKQAVADLNKSLEELRKFKSDIEGKSSLSDDEIRHYEELKNNINEAAKALSNLTSAEKGMKGVSVQKEIAKINQALEQNPRYSKAAKEALREMLQELQSGVSTKGLDEIHQKLLQIQNDEAAAGRAGKGLWDTIKEKQWYGLASQLAGMFSLYDVFNVAKEGFEVVKEFDSAFTEMRKVSNETQQSLKEYQATTFDVADAVGTTALQIQNSTADWMRLGESIDEAAQSAKDSTVLLNVSEFESIDEATDALVSMSQAYKDLDKMDIIDVLNNIGNNYSISTDGLATALKDSASSLVTANNDLNEATALITAGNAVTQDPSKVGAGLRTISLRLVGTEDAKEELEELGESTEGMVTTVSKLRDTIKTATRDASKDGQGFDILDDNGNYKSTYEIMQGLADLYDDIVKKDKELGTNNLNLLLETIAGKNRANIAASILQNGDMLRSVYADAQNSEGSAETELNAYLDSIEGKLTQLQNRAQEFWTKVINSDAIKSGIDMLTNLVELATKFVDTIGTIPTLGGLLSVFASFKGKGEHTIVFQW